MFGKKRTWWGIGLAILAAIAVWVSPLGLEPKAHRLAVVFAFTVVAWVTECIPIYMTALLIGPAIVTAGITDSRTAFAPYADPLIFLFIGSFFIARAMMRHGFDRRIAHRLLTLRVLQGSATRMRVAFVVAALGLSMWISNTAACAILLPVLLGTFGEDENDAGISERGSGGVLAVAYACSIGGMGTLVGTPPNVITTRFLAEQGVDIGFVEWMSFGLPCAMVLLTVAMTLLQWLAPPPPVRAPPAATHKPWTPGERVTAACFGLAVLGWTVPPLLEMLGVPGGASIAKALPIGPVAIFAATPLFLFHDENDEPVLPWSDAVRIDWGLIVLFGGGLALGKQMFETGLAAEASRWFLEAGGIESLWGLTGALIVFTVFFTEVCSNTASSNMILPLAIAAAVQLGVSPIPPALGVGLAASCAFMLPIATGPNAVAYGTGTLRLPQMMRVGLVLNIACAITLWLTLRAMAVVFGWG